MVQKIASLLSVLLFLVTTSCNNMNIYESYTDTIEVNGQSLFYAVEGSGKPVVLLHGNGGSHNDLETTTRQLAQAGYKVYAIDSRGQGANLALPEYHYADMAEDVYQFIAKQKIEKPAVFGWSDGGIVAIMTEVLHPGTFSVLATSGANVTVEGSLDEQVFRDIFGDETAERTPLVQMMYEEPNMTDEQLKTIACPALICAGEHDLILESHTRHIAACIRNAYLKIVPGADHGSHIWHNRLMGDILLDYFEITGY